MDHFSFGALMIGPFFCLPVVCAAFDYRLKLMRFQRAQDRATDTSDARPAKPSFGRLWADWFWVVLGLYAMFGILFLVVRLFLPLIWAG